MVQDGPIRARPLGDVRAANIVLVLQQRVAATRHRVLLATSHQEVTSVSAIALISSTDQQLVAHGDALDGPTALPSSPTHTGTWPSGTPLPFFFARTWRRAAAGAAPSSPAATVRDSRPCPSSSPSPLREPGHHGHCDPSATDGR